MKMSDVFNLPVRKEVVAYYVCETEEALDIIVHAVNSHDKLVEALRYIYEESRNSMETEEVAYKALQELDGK